MSVLQPFLDLEVLALLSAANGAPVITKYLLSNRFPQPLDRGRRFIDGRPLFGASKTIRGLISSIASTCVVAIMLALPWSTGLAVAIVAMLGDLFSSFLKRRMGLASGDMALGLDQIPESLMPSLICINLVGLTIIDVLVIVAVFCIGELLLSRLLFDLRIRDRPY